MLTARLLLHAPAQAIAGQPVWLLLVAERENGRTDIDYGGTVEFSCTDGRAELPRSTTVLACERGRHLFSITLHQPGEHRVTVRDVAAEAGESLEARTATIAVTSSTPEMRLFWGDTHGHTGEYGCGYGTIDSFYTYARDYAGLDFCALTEHDKMPNLAHDLGTIWGRVRRSTAYYNDPGRFVTLLGYEWTSQRTQKPDDPEAAYGHRHVLYRGDDEPWFGCHQAGSDTPEGLWRSLEGRDALVIPHHPAAPSQWATQWSRWNPQLERLVEVYSCWGSSERPRAAGNHLAVRNFGGEGATGHVQEALGNGYRMGFSAAGDSHDGSPGDTWFERPLGKGEIKRLGDTVYPGGLHALWARDLTREALWEALWSRRSYGTSGARIRIEYTLNGAWMGSELREPGDAPRHIRARVVGAAALRSVEVVKNGEDWRSFVPEANARGECVVDVVDMPEATVDVSRSTTGRRGGADHYYVRATQVDGETAWASPIWVDGVAGNG